MPEADALHMVQLDLPIRDLVRSAKEQGIHRGADDWGYALHGRLAALLGDLAPKPFHVEERRGSFKVLGYGSADRRALEERAELADPADARLLESLAVKAMPARWTEGRRLAFEVRVCPTVRHGSTEVDAFLSAVRRLGEGETTTRDAVYRDWLARKLDGAARLDSCRVERFRLARLFRRGRRGPQGRPGNTPRFPVAVLQGELTVVDGEAFARLLARGIGRHRAFGFGMLLLRPPARA